MESINKTLLLTGLCALALTACGDDAANNDPDGGGHAGHGGDGGGMGDIDIAGDYTDPFDGSHSITNSAWTMDGPAVFHFTSIENDEMSAFAHNAKDNEYNPDTFSRFDWTYDSDDALWYCQTAYDAETIEEAMETPRADDTDPANSGCGDFNWTQLTPVP